VASNQALASVRDWFEEQVARLSPLGLGSLSLRRTRCIRAGCAACERGEQHRSYVLYSRVKRRRRAVYVPEALVPEIEQALKRGRELQALMYEAAVRYTRALKAERQRRRPGLDSMEGQQR
jgi:hypothetical protein